MGAFPFLLGLPLGVGLGFVVGGAMTQYWGWRPALWVAGLPGGTWRYSSNTNPDNVTLRNSCARSAATCRGAATPSWPNALGCRFQER